jgi:hypothetical protein
VMQEIVGAAEHLQRPRRAHALCNGRTDHTGVGQGDQLLRRILKAATGLMHQRASQVEA